jgi:cation diffusion facilitator CzcD-associated flavoprotein CzcO
MAASGHVAIVGGGLAGFIAYLTLRSGGIEPDAITVFSTEIDPAAAWCRRARAIRQREMRSESDGHCLPHSFPGLAVRAARRQGLVPLALSACNRYHPTVEEFLDQVAEQRARSEWDRRVRVQRVTRVRAVDDGFMLDGAAAYRHVLLATGHPGLAVPEDLAHDPRVVHAYEPHDYRDDVAVVGAGMAAATEWLNALSAGARVTSVRRHEPVRTPLNVPRQLFSRRGLSRYHATTRDERADVLGRLLAPSFPPGKTWDEPLARAARDGRFRVASSVDGEAQVICATGFVTGARQDRLLRTLIEEHGLETCDRWLVVAEDCTVPSLTTAERTLGVAGVAAQWAYPAADTLVGMKYAARSFLRRVRKCPTR